MTKAKKQKEKQKRDSKKITLYGYTEEKDLYVPVRIYNGASIYSSSRCLCLRQQTPPTSNRPLVKASPVQTRLQLDNFPPGSLFCGIGLIYISYGEIYFSLLPINGPAAHACERPELLQPLFRQQHRQLRYRQQWTVMAPPRRNLLSKDRFAFAFDSLKTQSYYDPASKAPGSHTCVFLSDEPFHSFRGAIADREFPDNSVFVP